MYLSCHTYYSLRYGTLSPTQLVQTAQLLGAKTLALTDINNTSCAVEFIRQCREAGIKPIIGLEFRQEGQLHYVGLARNAEGVRELNEWLTRHSLEGKSLPELAPPLENAFFIYPRLVKPIAQFRENELLGIRPEHVHRLFSSEVRQYPQHLVMFSPVTFLNQEGHQLHQLLRAIDENTVLSKVDASKMAKKTEVFIPPKTLLQYYKAYPRIIHNTRRIVEACSIEWTQGLHVNRQTFTGSREGDFQLLQKLALNGCKQRYGAHHVQALERTRKELRVIREQDFCAYFLITWDIVRYAHSMGYHHVGRGSGANSIVAFCLYITDVDPLELDLYFERFINPYRSSPPDFDIDFSWDERDDVTDYIFKRYGKEYTALLATYNTFQGRSTVRELGKVFGLPKHEIDLIVEHPEATDRHHELAGKIFHYGRQLEGFPNYLSIHAGGVVISERPLSYHTALQMMPKGFPITHFDMYHAEDMGFHKYDVLSQRGLGHLKDAVELVKANQGKAVDIYAIERIKKDPKVRTQLRSGHCIGCFYIESPAMRGLLNKLHCDNYVHLVAASSIIRPGVAQSGMMREYIHRFHHPDSFEYLHPVFREHLGETFGVMVYQEDVMKIVHHFAGLDLDESDVLRRIMTGKKAKSDTFERLRQKYFDNCRARGYSEELTQEVWRQIESFGGYSFCKAHSASFAVESFQSLYLKAYFPLEFMVAVINNFGGFYQTEYYVHEARMQGGHIHAPCVNHSRYLTHIEGTDIYLGFVHIQQLERKAAHRVVAQRSQGGPFRSLEDFVQRVEISTDQLDLLIRIGAFRFTGHSKYELMWEKFAAFHPKEKYDPTLPLFEETPTHFTLPNLEEGPFDQAFDEIELLGFPLCSPFELLDDASPKDGVSAAQLSRFTGRLVHCYGYYVCRKHVRTVRGETMYFGTWLDEEGHFFDTTHFPAFLRQGPFTGKGIYRIEGKVTEDFGFPSIEVIRMERLPFREDERNKT
ncbi:MAG: DNA polymerase III subunit alpha [Lewinellaceae bacterium]|nr:DNA polymerase III subunit alpha [Lewinellaceae bacterium]